MHSMHDADSFCMNYSIKAVCRADDQPHHGSLRVFATQGNFNNSLQLVYIVSSSVLVHISLDITP